MATLILVGNGELLARMPELVLAERRCATDVIEHLVEIDRRRIYLDAACSSLSSYCTERLGYSEDEAAVRVRVARLAARCPQVLEELRDGKLHLSGLALLAQYVTAENADALVAEARGRSKRQIEELIARRFPRPDVPDRIGREPQQLQVGLLGGSTGARPNSSGTAPANHESTRSGPGTNLASRSSPTEPLSESRWAVQFTASTELHRKIERATELLSHAVPNGDLATLFERALDALIEQETKRRLGAGTSRKRRPLADGSRHIPVEVARQVWERDGGQCTFVDADGRRCGARRFVTFEHLVPFALGELPTVENLCLRCKAHNLHAAREVFGAETINAKCAERKRAMMLRNSSRWGTTTLSRRCTQRYAR